MRVFSFTPLKLCFFDFPIISESFFGTHEGLWIKLP